MKNEILLNLDKLHTTTMGISRIQTNLQIEVEDVVQYCRDILAKDETYIERKGKNWYAYYDNICITINAKSYTIITAHKVMSLTPNQGFVTTHQGNPFLPLWEYIPDGEPYVFEDPEEKGKYRVYLYGSHDLRKTDYCGRDQVLWSAPVENLTHWRYEGIIFTSPVEGSKEQADILFAPDVAYVEKDGQKQYYFYPNNQAGNRQAMVAVASTPIGPFEVVNWANAEKTCTKGDLGFDPAVYYDKETGKAYGYWGFIESYWGELETDKLACIKEGTQAKRNIPSYDAAHDTAYDPSKYNIVIDEHIDKWGFFEASSIRKVGNKYVFIYSRNGLPHEPTGKNYNQLAYGYSDSPEGPWKWGGIIVDAAGETIPNKSGGYDRTFKGGNTHGSICEINDAWYIFYHRNLHDFARQAMVEKIEVSWDEKPVVEGGQVRISTAEVTSQGFYTEGLNPYLKHSAGIACYVVGGTVKPLYTVDTTTLPIVDLKNNSIVGIKYFDFTTKKQSVIQALEIELIPQGVEASIDVYIRGKEAVNTELQTDEQGRIISVGKNSQKLGSYHITADMPKEMTTLSMPISDAHILQDKQGLFFVFNTKSETEIGHFYNLQFK